MTEAKWYESSGSDGDIAVSTRARLARNLKDYPFPGHMNSAEQQTVMDLVSSLMVEAAGGNEFEFIDLGSADPALALSLVERHLISPQMIKKDYGCHGVVLSRDEGVSVMICEEDHLRIQKLLPGHCVWECLKEVETVDKLIEGSVSYAFDARLGYLTRCPTNLGTGLRLSVMLHLPALTETGHIRYVSEQAAKLGFAVRGMYGEGTRPEGSIYQISNQITLGLTESEIARQLESAVQDLIGREKSMRRQLMNNDPTAMEDRVWRAHAILSSARRIDTAEAMSLLSDLRLGVSIGLIDGIGFETLNGLMTKIQPSLVSGTGGGNLSGNERDALRANIIRQALVG